MESFLFVLVLIGFALYWYVAQEAKTYAVKYATRECERQKVQLLDQTVQQIRLSMSRDKHYQWRFWREYRFEYSFDDIYRYEGRLILLGNRLQRIALDH